MQKLLLWAGTVRKQNRSANSCNSGSSETLPALSLMKQNEEGRIHNMSEKMDEQEIELSEADEVTGGGVGKWYYTYARFVKRTIDAAWRDGYRKAACPNCGAILALQNVVCYTDEELQMASQEKIKCHNCGTVNTGEAWATSTRK